MEEITLNSTITRNEDLLSGVLDDETILMSIETGSYHVINKTANRIWELLEEPKTVDEICIIILDEYEVDPETCQKEVLEFMAGLQNRKIVVVS